MKTETTGQSKQGVDTLKVSLRLLRQFGTGESRRVALGLGLMLATAAVQLLQPWPLKIILDCLAGAAPPPSLAFAAGTKWLVPVLCAAILVTYVLAGLLDVLATYVIVAAGLRMVFRLRCALFDHIQRLSLRFHDSTSIGESLYRVTWDTYSIQAIFNSGLVPLVTSVLTVVGIGIVVACRDVLVAIVALAVMVPLTLLLRLLDRPMTERSLQVHERESDISAHVQETLTGIRAVQAFGREPVESRRFRGAADASLRAKLRLHVLESASGAAVSTLLACGTAAVVYVTALRVAQGRLTPGDVVLLVAYVTMLYRPLNNIAQTAVTLQSTAARAFRVCSLLDAAPDVRDLPTAQPLTARATGRVAFEGVSFGYRPDQPILRDVTTEILPGTTVALVGASGAGKTTLVSLLLRFYDPDRGRITLDGRDLRDLTLGSLRANVALVLQEPVLFAASVRENIAYGNPAATPEQIRAAATAAGADQFIESLPNGYDTQIGERGVSLSGGQRQRLSIARAFLQDAPILIMDEPTSALDTQTEAALLHTLDQLRRDRTVIVIAHRLSTIRTADTILVLDRGEIVESGPHAELLLCKGPYARLCAAQTGQPINASAPPALVAN